MSQNNESESSKALVACLQTALNKMGEEVIPAYKQHDIWTNKDIAEYLRCSIKTVTGLTNKKDFPKKISVTGHPRWYAEEVKRYIKQGR